MKGFAPLLSLCLLAQAANAYEPDPVVYVGAQLSQLSYSSSAFDDQDLASYGAVFGAWVNRYWALEGRYSVGEEGERLDDGRHLDVNHLYGAYLRGGFPLGEHLYPYVLVGRTKVEFNGGADGDGGKSGTSYGLGVTVHAWASPAILNIEYASLIDGEDYNVEGLTIGVQIDF